MPAESACFAFLPGAWPEAVIGPGASGGEPMFSAIGVTISIGTAVEQASGCAFLPPRAVSALKLDDAEGGSAAEAAAAQAQRLVFVLPAGRYDDGVWSPIVERLLWRRLGKAGEGVSTAIAWSGLEPYLAAYGPAGADAWSKPGLPAAVTAPLEAAAGSLSAVIRDLLAEHGAGAVRRGVVGFAPAAQGGVRLALD